MKKNITLTDCVKQLEREKLMACASNLGVELNAEWSTDQMRQAYADYVLTNPKELIMMLPMEDIKILMPSEKDKPGKPISLFNTNLVPIFVEYGLAEMEVVSNTAVDITIPDDFLKAVTPYLDWALSDNENSSRMYVELIVAGLTNIFGIVTQQEIRKYLKLLGTDISDEQAKAILGYTRQYSLLLDSMEWREHGEDTAEEDVLFVSRYGWDDRGAMKQFIEQHSREIPAPREFSLETVIGAGGNLSAMTSNVHTDNFRRYLTTELGLDEDEALQLCFKLWHSKMQVGESDIADNMMEANFCTYALMRPECDLTEEQYEEGMRQLTDYANHIPLWHLRGFTAADYPSEAYVPMKKAKFKGPLGAELKRMKGEMQWMTELLSDKSPSARKMLQQQSPSPKKTVQQKEENPWAGRKIGRNDPCPCGSGLKYKKCHGKS